MVTTLAVVEVHPAVDNLLVGLPLAELPPQVRRQVAARLGRAAGLGCREHSRHRGRGG
jgi:hypothetical protein